MFPFSIEGAIAVRPNEVDAVLDRMKLAVRNVQAKSIERKKDTLIFRGGLFRWGVNNWNILGPVDECSIIAETGKLRFICSTRQLFAHCLGAAAIFWLFIRIKMDGRASMEMQIIVPLVAWVWLFGMNYLISSWRLPRFFRKAASEACGRVND